jgi:hypothetical protein
MAAEKSLSGRNLGTVLETYGGKSLKRFVIVGAAEDVEDDGEFI